MGFAYRRGRGVAKNDGKSVFWYKKGAAQGHRSAQNNLGFAYQHGKGVGQDYAQALRWCRKSAEQGRSSAQLNLGYMYEKGNGVGADFDAPTIVHSGHGRILNVAGRVMAGATTSGVSVAGRRTGKETKAGIVFALHTPPQR